MSRPPSSSLARLLVVVLAASVVSVTFDARPAAAASSDSEKKSRRAFKEAEEHFKAGRFAEALAAYQAGYDSFPLPGFLINIAQCHRRLGDLTKARATYQKFIMVAPDSPHIPEVTTLIAELDKLIANLERPAPEPVSGEGTAPPTEPEKPVPAAVPPPAPPPVLVAAPPPSPVASEPPPRRRWWLWGLAGVAVAGAGATIAVLALSSPGTTTLHEGSLGTLRR